MSLHNKTNFPILFLVLSLALVGASACDGGGHSHADALPLIDAPPGGLAVDGIVDGTAIPANAKAVVVWVVTATMGDYTYKWGEGASENTSFVLTLPGEPPPQALNLNTLGVGILVLVDANLQIPDGVVNFDQIQMLGASPQHAIIYRAPGSQPYVPWLNAFPEGYGCGVCVPAMTGFDSFDPVACSQVTITTTNDINTLHFCNWT